MRVAGGIARGRKLKVPRKLGARPTSRLVRSAIFNRLAVSGIEGATLLDLYAGTGSLGLEALSRGGKSSSAASSSSS